MARLKYAAAPADYFIDAGGAPVPGAVANVWNAETGGTQQTSLLDSSGAATTVVTADSFGGFRFSGPDGYTGTLWIQSPGGSLRYRVDPTTMPERLTTAEAAIVTNAAAVVTETAARTSADAAVATAAASDAAARIAAHQTDVNAHAQYAQFLAAATGLPWTGRPWVGSTFPTAALGAADGDLLFFLG